MTYFRLWSCRISDCTSVVFHDTIFHVSDWLEMACTNNTQCLARNSECFARTCLCTPGYYYSITSLSCLDSKWAVIHVVSVITTPALTSPVLAVSGQLYMSSVLLLLQYSRLVCECWSSKWTVIHVVSVITTPSLPSPVLTVSGQLYMSSVSLLLQHSHRRREYWSSNNTDDMYNCLLTVKTGEVSAGVVMTLMTCITAHLLPRQEK